MLTALLAALLVASPAAPTAPAALHDHLLATATFDVDLDGQPDELRILAPEGELHTGEPICKDCPPEDFIAGRFVADVKLSKSGKTVRSPLVFDPEVPAWELKQSGQPGAREVLRFPYRNEPAPLQIERFAESPHFNLVQFLDAGSSQYALFTLKADGTVVRFEEDEDTITTDGDVLAASRLQMVFELPSSPPPPAEPRPFCRWDETASKQPSAGHGYSLCVFGENWFEMGLGYEMQRALDTLRQHAAKEAIACFGAESIDRFDWDMQRLTLTREATGRLAHALDLYESKAKRTGAAADFAEGEGKLKDLMESLGWNSAIESDLRLRAFQVRVDGKLVYGGIFLDPTSQMGIDFPVARVDAESDCRAAFNFLPVHLPFLTVDPVDESGKVRNLNVTEEARDDTQALDENDKFFTHWATERALAPHALELRRLVRDPSIRRSLEEAGKLQERPADRPGQPGR